MRAPWLLHGAPWACTGRAGGALQAQRSRPRCPPGPSLPPAQVGKETGGKKLEEPHALKANEMAEVVFEPCQPLVVDSFKNCEGLSRIAFLDGNTAVMLGKVRGARDGVQGGAARRGGPLSSLARVGAAGHRSVRGPAARLGHSGAG